MTSRIQRWILTLTTALAAVACGDRIVTEPQVATSGGPSLSIAGGGIVGLLKRTEPLPHRLVTSRVIGPRGGHIEIGRAGLRVEFAPGAVRTPTRITVAALRGRNVAYRFEPHGLEFAAPVTIRQDLRRTVAWRNPAVSAGLEGSYFDRLLVDPTETYARSLERRRGRRHGGDAAFEFSIEHFSGYMISVGLVKVEVDVDVNIDISNR